jgi:cytochrome c553
MRTLAALPPCDDPSSPSLIWEPPRARMVPRVVAFSSMISRRALAVAVSTMLVGGCADLAPDQDAFKASGEVIALSGGDAGARGACVTCHGLKGEGDGNLAPRLAGLDPGYFARQLEYYSEGMRSHPQMTWIADRLDGPAREKLARYYAGLPVPAAAPAKQANCVGAVLYHHGDPSRALPSCASCHGSDGKGAGLGNPPLASQPAPYNVEQLERWRKGERYGDAGRVMMRVSRLLSDAEVKQVGGYTPDPRDATAYPGSLAACRGTHRPDPRSGA